MPFWIKPGPKTFQRHLANILKEIDNCFLYIDDNVLYSKTKKKHAQLLAKTLRALYDNQGKIGFDKSKLFTTELDILGYRVTKEGIFLKTANLTKKILNIKLNLNKSVQKVVEILNWHRKFVPNLLTKIGDISEMLKKGTTNYVL